MSGQAAFTVTEDDLLAAYRLHFCGVRQGALVLLAVYLALMGALLAWLDGSTSLADVVWNIAWLAAVIIGFVVLLKLLLGWLWLPRSARRILGQQKTLHGEQSFSWTDSALASISRVGQAQVAWTDYHAYAHNADVVLVYQSEAIFHLLPTRGFASAAVLTDLLATIARAGVPVRSGRVFCRLQQAPVQP